ncbi:MAG: sialate O-acetylesterase [Opitutaceae bacterium]|jgi:sialate O-acetylesterase|nr:sialate O-acetylesterase [Opitutaceae bacterium]
MKTRLLFLSLFSLQLSVSAAAAVRPASLFQDHAVLQADMKIPVWGQAGAGERVAVSFAGQRLETTADAGGGWRVDLDPVAAGKSGDLVIGEHVFTDVVAGEVWFVGGQSNAALSLARAAPDAAREIASAGFPQIRVWTSGYAVARTPQAFAKGGDWKLCSPETAGAFTGMGYFFAKELQAALGVPVGIISCNKGGAPVGSMMDEALFDQNPGAPEAEAYYDKVLRRSKKNQHMRKGVLWNGMVAPLAPFALRGVLWNQGEADVRVARAYESLFAGMVACWRAAWGRVDLPFYVVQLASISDAGSLEPPESDNWPLLREAQANTRKIPGVRVSVGVDIGSLSDNAQKARHPANKRELGRRLALLALGGAYGKPGLCASPFFEAATVANGKIICRLDSAAKGLRTSGNLPPGGFEIAGADGKFVPAAASIDGETLVVFSPKVPAPAAVRYAWSNTCSGANIVNAAGLPLAPFHAQINRETPNKNKPLNSTAKDTKDAKNGNMKLEKQQHSELSSFAPFASFAVEKPNQKLNHR